ncbi:MAG: FAD-dependent oxidoreductase [Methanolobus sp.]
MSLEFEEPVTEIIKRTYNVKSFRFRRPEDFEYKAGQYVIVKLWDGEKKKGKPFTLSSSPTEKDHIEFTKKLTGHEFSNMLDAMKPGDKATIKGPFGKLVYEGGLDKIALLGGGIGITPMISICKYCTDMEVDTDIMLICSNKTEEDLIFTEEFDEMQKQNPKLTVFNTLTRASEDWAGCGNVSVKT